MFGLMNPGRQDTVFRRAYARCCQHQRRSHGLPSLAFLSYESVLLYLFALDAGKLSADDLPRQTCCRLRPLPSKAPPAEREVARFCASLGLLLAYIKVADDARDGGSLPSRLAGWLLRRRFREVFAYFGRLDPGFETRVNAVVDAHLELERAGGPVALEEYVRPTAEAFGYVFGLMARLPGLEGRREELTRLGQHVGAAIIAFDCAADWHRDRRRGDFNPLPDGDASLRAALSYSQSRLSQAATECVAAFGDGSRVARALCGVHDRIAQRCCRASACEQVRASAEERMQRWGLARQKGAVQLNTGWEVWAAVGGAFAFGLSALKWAFAPRPMLSAGRQPDVPPDVPPEMVGGAAPTPLVSDEQKKQACGACECCDAPCECAGEACPGNCGNACDGCGGAGEAAGGGCDCSGCDCGGCDCSCG